MFFVAIIRWNKSFFIIMWKSGEELSRNCGRHISRKVLFGTFSGTICVNIGTKSRSVQFCACTGAHSACFTSKKEQELLLIDSIIIIWYKLIKNVSYYSWSSFFIRKPILEVFSPYWCGYKVSRYWNILNVISVTSFVGREGLQPGNFALEGATRTD